MSTPLPDAQQLFSRLRGCITPAARAAFATAFFSGMLTHLYMFTNKLFGRDDLLCLFVNNDMVSHGRWLLKYPSALSSAYSLPLIGGLISIFAIALAAALIVTLLKIDQPLYAGLTGLILVTFPSVANTFSYMFVADAFFVSFLIACLGAYATDRCKRGYLWGAGLFVISMAIYQAYICFVIPLLILRMLSLLLAKESTDREILVKTGQYLASVVLGVAAYVLLTKLIVPLHGLELGAGQGLSSMGQIRFAELPRLLSRTVWEFAEWWLRTSMIVSNRAVRYLHIAIGLFEVAAILLVTFRTRRKSTLQRTMTLLILLTVPVTFNAIYMLGSNYVHWVMIYANALIYILMPLCCQALARSHAIKPFRWPSLPAAASLFTALMLLTVSCIWAVNANKVYFAMDLYYENCYALSNRVLYDVEHHPDYEKNMPVAVAGSFTEGNYSPTKDGIFKSLARQNALQSPNDYVLIYDDYHFRAFSRYFLGFMSYEPDREALSQALNSETFAAMPCYPAEGCMQVLDGIMLVKAGG